MSFSETLRVLIDDRDMTQKQLAIALGITPSTLGGYVQGLREPDFATLKLLATYFQVSTDYLLDHRTGSAATQAEDELLLTFRTLTEEQQRVYIEQGKAFARMNQREKTVKKSS